MQMQLRDHSVMKISAWADSEKNMWLWVDSVMKLQLWADYEMKMLLQALYNAKSMMAQTSVTLVLIQP